MKTAKDIRAAIENGSVVITKIVRETLEGPHIWGRNAFEYSPLSRGFNRVKNNMLTFLLDMEIAEEGIGTDVDIYKSCFDVGVNRMFVPNTNNPKWWYVVFFDTK
jgi:hypothetical protein